MTGYLNIILRLTIWFLLTADLSWANIVIGVGVTLLLPRGVTNVGLLKDWLRTLWEVVVAIPQAYKEAFEIMLYPHREETVVLERVKPRRTPSLIFLDIFLITFTPKTIVQRYHSQGWYEVHYIQRRETP
ncbi:MULTISPECIES: cation:proton antiporter [Cyanophyceae]|uniref:cation:proton antiporter n=1 Tax=Cyanophyceae TaxID=3028117 RepID=UPI0016870B4F|nr:MULTISPECIES: cation:proton antiporter [Cyanophyceae]MBD1919154.1 cation:proton antiporter [Phormidium sp. FACHB-77]MBD2028990.1 cation:proton antiporter [Phormidium sp. FACHB-322]MBD2054105.1 cation:proton antiporter [Leptolyngbya sp. FACHB-60]